MTIPELAAAQRRFFDSGRTRSVAFREEQLRRLHAGPPAHVALDEARGLVGR